MFERATAKLQAGQSVEWHSLVTEFLGLPMRYLPGVQLALVQGRWRSAKDPKAYIRTVAKREAAKMESPRERGETLKIPKNVYDEDGKALSEQDYIDHTSYDYGPVKNGGVWRARNPLDEAVSVDDKGRVLPELNGRAVPEHLLKLEDEDADAKLIINWQRVVEEADLDIEVAQILELRCLGYTRAVILDELARDDEERRRWQAAWRRMDRHMDRIRTVLAGAKNYVATNVPKSRFPRTR